MNIDLIRNSLGRYYLATNPGYKYVAYQQEKIAPALEALERREIRRLMINMGPGFAKSDWATRTFVPWYLGRNPAHNALVGSYSADLASDDFGAKIKARMQTPMHLKIFPKSKLTQDSRAKTHFSTVSGGNFYSVGFSGSWTGKRLDLCVIDDLIKSFAEADSETVQDALFADYKGTIKDRMRPNGVIVICAHRWRPRDVYGRILEHDGTIENGGAWTVLRLPAEDPPDSGKFLWLRSSPDEPGFPLSFYADFKKDEDVWAAKFQQDPSSSSNKWFKKEWLNFYQIAPKPGKFKTYLFCDPGASKDRKSDRTSIQVFAAGQDQKLFLVDWVLDRIDAIERQAILERLIRRHQPEISLFEEYGLLNDATFFNAEAEKTGFDAVLTPVGKKGPRHNLSKADRIRGLKTWFSRGQIYLPQKFMYRMSNGQEVDLTRRFIDEEYELYCGAGSVAHEDDLDCMSRLDDLMPPFGAGFDWYVPENERPERKVSGHAGTWMSIY